MNRLISVALVTFVLCFSAPAQEKKSWLNLTNDEAAKLLSSSAWAQEQVDTDTSEMFFSPTRPGSATLFDPNPTIGRVSDQQSRNNNRADRGALNQAVSTKFFVRFFSARPIREALSRIVILGTVEPSRALLEQWQGFVDRDFSQYIVMTVTVGSSDGRFLGPSLQAFASSTASSLKNSTYLETSDGKRVYLMDYRPPQDDGLGAKFVFPRNVNGGPFLSKPGGHVRFVAQMSEAVKLNVKFNVADMVVDGKVEY